MVRCGDVLIYLKSKIFSLPVGFINILQQIPIDKFRAKCWKNKICEYFLSTSVGCVFFCKATKFVSNGWNLLSIMNIVYISEYWCWQNISSRHISYSRSFITTFIFINFFFSDPEINDFIKISARKVVAVCIKITKIVITGVV